MSGINSLPILMQKQDSLPAENDIKDAQSKQAETNTLVVGKAPKENSEEHNSQDAEIQINISCENRERKSNTESGSQQLTSWKKKGEVDEESDLKIKTSQLHLGNTTSIDLTTTDNKMLSTQISSRAFQTTQAVVETHDSHVIDIKNKATEAKKKNQKPVSKVKKFCTIFCMIFCFPLWILSLCCAKDQKDDPSVESYSEESIPNENCSVCEGCCLGCAICGYIAAQCTCGSSN